VPTHASDVRAPLPLESISPKKTTASGFRREVTPQLLRRLSSDKIRRKGLIDQLAWEKRAG